MGDLLSPKRRDVFDRLRRRIEQYRRHNQHNVGRLESNLNGLYEQQQHDTNLLQQRWLESKAKRNQKNKTSNNSGNNASNQQQQQQGNCKDLQVGSHALTQQKLKRKLDANTATGNNPNNSAESSSYNFDDGVGSPPPNKANKQDSSLDSQVHSSVSVNIVQQINTQSEHAGTSQIKVTLTSNLQTGGALRPEAQTSTSVETKTNVCKSEPVDDSQCAGPSSSSSHASLPEPPIGIEDIDDLQAILDSLEKEGEIPPEFMKDLDLLKEDINSDNLSTDKEDDTLSNKNQMFSGTNTKRSSGPGMFAEPALYDNSSSSQGSGSVVNNGMGGPSAASVVNYPRPPTGGGAAVHPPQVPQTPPMLGDTGPAAETLKQMAAQHQNQNYGMKSNYGEFPDGYGRRGMMPPHGYSQYPQQYNMANAAQNNMYYGPQTPNAMGNVRPPYPHQGPGMHPGMGIKPDPSYGGTKPLSHFPVEAMAGGGGPQGQNGPSSLQQLQNQVQSTFNHQGQNAGHPGPQGMQINQSQQMHMSHGSQRMQLSQTQQMQIHAGSNISVAQQQSFSMNPQGKNFGMHPQQHPQYMNPEQMKMQQMYRDQQQRQMQSYMNRPPPEYKVPPGGMPAGNYGVPNGMGNANPMQNMQKMVNQTNHATPGQNGMYPAGAGGSMKTEQTGGMPAGQGPPHSGSSGSPANLPCQPNTPTEGAAPNIGNYPNAAAQQQQMMQGQHMPRHSMPMSTQNRPNKPGTPTYTSAILRGQRPPNVNVGPEGLNISQQRPHSADWHRQSMAQGPAGSPMPQSGAMAYGYQGQAMGMQAGPGGPRMAMAQQQHALQHNAPNAQQQHRMAMMQQMHSSQQQGGQSMSQGMSTASTPTSQQQQQQAPTPHSQQAQSYPPQQQPQQQQQGAPNGTAEFIPLDFLDNQQTGNSDFPFTDSNSTDIFDELFGNGRE